MRSGLDAATRNLYVSEEYDIHTKLSVENGSGTQIYVHDRARQVEIKYPNPAEPIGSLTVDFYRENTKEGSTTSLAPTVGDSAYNRLDDEVTYSPLLQLGRIVRVEIALTSIGGDRPAANAVTWYEIFHGYIIDVDWPKWEAGRARIRCHDLGGILQHQKTEAEYTYDAGTSIEAVVRSILDNNGFNYISTHFPVATGKVLSLNYAPGLQKTVWSQLSDMMAAIGWTLAFRYRARGAVELNFFEPQRTKDVLDLTLAHWWEFDALRISEAEVRNVGRVQYVDGDGNLQLEGPLENAASITKYGGSRNIRRPFWIVLDETSPVRSQADAAALLADALSDVADPDVVASVQTNPLVFVENGSDLYRFKHKKRYFDADQDYAPFRSKLTITHQRAFSTTEVRGKPSAGTATWRKLGAFAEVDRTAVISVAMEVNQNTGAVKIVGTVPENVQSIRYNHKVAASPDFPTASQIRGGTLIQNVDKTFSAALPANTVEAGHLIKAGFIAYTKDTVASPIYYAIGERRAVVDFDPSTIVPDTIISGVSDGAITANLLVEAARNWVTNLVWKRVDWNTVKWHGPSEDDDDTVSGKLAFQAGSEYVIPAGNTDELGGLGSNAVRYIYFDTSAPERLRMTADIFSVDNENRILVAAVWRDPDGQQLVNGVEQGRAAVVPINSPSLIITAAMIDVAQLSALSADVGRITAGSIKSPDTSTPGEGRLEIDLDAGGANPFFQFFRINPDGTKTIVMRLLANGNAEFGGVVRANSFLGTAPTFAQTVFVYGGQSLAGSKLCSINHERVQFNNGDTVARLLFGANGQLRLIPGGTDNIFLDGPVRVGGAGDKLGFFGAAPIAKPTIG